MRGAINFASPLPTAGCLGRFTSKRLDQPACLNGVELDFTRPEKRAGEPEAVHA